MDLESPLVDGGKCDFYLDYIVDRGFSTYFEKWDVVQTGKSESPEQDCVIDRSHV